MSRRDTIIIAVLVNAGLLIVLFATAMRSDKSPELHTPPLAEAHASYEQIEPLASATPQEDQVDALLSQYGAVPTLGAGQEEIVFSSESTSPLLVEELLPSQSPALPLSIVTHDQQPKIDNPSPPSLASVSSAAKTISVTVKKGDVLEKIAKANCSSVAGIMKANQLTSTQLKIGQVLKVPVKEGVATVSKPSSTQTDSEYYTVKDGDSPWLIASKNHVKLDELLRLNNLDEQKAKRLRPGDRLRIR